jgi:hypothetical protein
MNRAQPLMKGEWAACLTQRPLIANYAMNGAQLSRFTVILMAGPPALRRQSGLEFSLTPAALSYTLCHA